MPVALPVTSPTLFSNRIGILLKNKIAEANVARNKRDCLGEIHKRFLGILLSAIRRSHHTGTRRCIGASLSDGPAPSKTNRKTNASMRGLSVVTSDPRAQYHRAVTVELQTSYTHPLCH